MTQFFIEKSNYFFLLKNFYFKFFQYLQLKCKLKMELVQSVLRVDLVIFILKCIILGMDFFSVHFLSDHCIFPNVWQKLLIKKLELIQSVYRGDLVIFLLYANNISSPTKPCKQQNNKVSWKRRKNKKNILQPQFIHFTNYFYFFR